MRHEYHIKVKGDRDYNSFLSFLAIHGLEYNHHIRTNSTHEDTVYDFLVDLTDVELMMVYITVTVIYCTPVTPDGDRVEIVG